MTQINPRRRRGVFLTDSGLRRVHDAIRGLAVHRDGVRPPLGSFSASAGLSTRTLSRALNRASPVDLRTLEVLFFALRLTPAEADYYYATFPTYRSSNHLLPQQLTPLIGREALLEVLEQLIDASRFLTLTGTGGVGKTRLAVELAKRQESMHNEVVWFFEFTAETDVRESVLNLATVLGVALDGRDASLLRPARQTALQGILVLDNCEGVAAELGRFAVRLLRLCPSLRVLATSRETFGIEGECVFRVPALALPEKRTKIKALEAQRYSAIALFAERARARNSGFIIDDEAAPTLAEIVHRLDGLPLAIELAAARSSEMSPADLLSYLRSHVGSLTSSGGDKDQRHRSMRALMDWSFERLSDPERIVFARTAIFSGSFDGAALSAVCCDVFAPDTVLEAAFQLARKSLLELNVQAMPTRFRLMATVRAYVCERLEKTPDHNLAAWHHALHYIHVTDELMRPVREQGRTENIQTLSQEFGNVRAALEWSFATNNEHIGAVLAAQLSEYWETRGEYCAGEGWMRRSLQTGAELMTLDTRARLYEGLALLLHRQVRSKEAHGAAICCLEIHEALGDTLNVPRVQNLLGMIDFDLGNMDSARKRYLANLRRGDSLNPRLAVATLLNLGRIERDVDGDTRGALKRFERSLIVAEKLGRRSVVALSLVEMADTYAALGNLFRAIVLGKQSMQVFRELENDPWYSRQAMNVAIWQIRAGGLQRSIPDTKIAFEAILIDPFRFELHAQLDSVAELLVDAGRSELAVTLLGAVASYYRPEGSAISLDASSFGRHTLQRAQEDLGVDLFENISARARGLSLESALHQTLILPFEVESSEEYHRPDAMLTPQTPAPAPAS